MLACRQNELFFCFNRGNCKKRRGEECCAQINPFQVKTLKVSVPSSTSQFKSRESLTQYSGCRKDGRTRDAEVVAEEDVAAISDTKVSTTNMDIVSTQRLLFLLILQN
jgi:hypothetical protein